jgi:hypothetical protein
LRGGERRPGQRLETGIGARGQDQVVEPRHQSVEDQKRGRL